MSECVYVQELTIGYDPAKIPWLTTIASENSSVGKKLCKNYLRDAQLWILEKIVKPLIRRFYCIVKIGRELEVVPKPLWCAFRQKVPTLRMVYQHQGSTFLGLEQLNLKKLRHSDQQKGGTTRIFADNPERWIIKPQKDKEFANTIGRIIRQAASNICLTKTTSLYKYWKEYQRQLNGKKNFGVKIDVQDAFGSININLMCQILGEVYKKGFISSDVQSILNYHIRNQYVICGKNKDGSPKIWKWNHGLCQGDRFSSALCQLYLSYLDSIHLHHLIQPHNFCFRIEDDYFFCSKTKTDIFEFMKIMESLHSLNKDKTQSNVKGFDHETINYYGRTFFLETGEVEGFYTFRKRSEIRHRFKLWNIKKSFYNRIVPLLFNETAMQYSVNNFRFQDIELNTIINTEERVLKNYFKAMILLGFKLDAAVMALKNIIQDFSTISKLIRKFVFKFAHKAFSKISKNKGCFNRERLSLAHFLKLGFVAFILVLKKREYYAKNQILDFMRRCERKFSNKIFGWAGLWRFRKLPECFNHISIQRRLPHHKFYLK
ncbi:hypothetical protein FQR65_LT08918 [Abscondita terminalis]|nr:hypothetical protein FQR65_LT08918 [Abscondita terminalis]